MENIVEYVKNLYLKDEYIIKHSALHEEDSSWKVSKIIPLVDRFIGYINKDEINLLDVGGGAGLILNAISAYIKESYDIKVNKFALDLSPGMLEIQRKKNPDLKRALNEDIRKTSLGDKEIDLALMIDILEHVPNPTKALEEIKRISKFAIFKVPLEDNLYVKVWNFVSRGKLRQCYIREFGHINIYNFGNLEYQVEKHAGQILDFYFANLFDYYRNSKHKRGKSKLIADFAAVHLFRLSPKLSSLISTDFAMLLVKCY